VGGLAQTMGEGRGALRFEASEVRRSQPAGEAGGRRSRLGFGMAKASARFEADWILAAPQVPHHHAAALIDRRTTKRET
jgi:hypothetical protein